MLAPNSETLANFQLEPSYNCPARASVSSVSPCASPPFDLLPALPVLRFLASGSTVPGPSSSQEPALFSPSYHNMSRNFIEDTAEVDEDENEDSFDEETGEVRDRSNRDRKHFDDSSEDDDDDDDEEAAAEVRSCSRLLLLGLLPLTCDRSPKASLSMKTKTKTMLPGARENANAGNDDEKNVIEKTRIWTKKIWNS